MKTIRYCYVGGAINPYPGERPALGFLANIHRGIRASIQLILQGYIPFCPFLDFLYFLIVQNGENITEKIIKDISMAWLERCDAILVLPRYRKSEGTLAEIARARELKIPIFYSLDDLMDYKPRRRK